MVSEEAIQEGKNFSCERYDTITIKKAAVQKTRSRNERSIFLMTTEYEWDAIKCTSCLELEIEWGSEVMRYRENAELYLWTTECGFIYAVNRVIRCPIINVWTVEHTHMGIKIIMLIIGYDITNKHQKSDY